MNYKILRLITIILTTIMLPFGTLVGYKLGSGAIKEALILLVAQTAITFIQAWIWWLTMERVKNEK